MDKKDTFKSKTNSFNTLEEQLQQGRILVLDGAMGTMIQTYGLQEEDFRGELLASYPGQMMGNNDILSLTRPDVISDIHRRYLQAGADIISTNTFNSQSISQADYRCEHLISDINRQAVRLARQAADEFSTAQRPRYVVASVGPTNKTCSMSPDVGNPAFRSINFDEMAEAYLEQFLALLQEGVDAILMETIFDTLNTKAAIFALQQAEEQTGIHVPLMLSVTISDKAGRLLSGQTLEAFLVSIAHARPLSVGLNCSFGAKDMLAPLRALAESANCFITVHPNAGLPNSLGEYDQTPEMMASQMTPFIEEHLVNVIGGCCGTTPEHIAALRALADEHVHEGHLPQADCNQIALCGLEALVREKQEGQTKGGFFVNVGERCNVAGSRKFLRLIKEKAYEEALDIARRQVEDGAMVIDINMDDGLLDAEQEMKHFLNLLTSDPDICRVPIMVDSSNWDVICAGLKCIQGKCIANSISLKEGEQAFLSHAHELKRLGAAVVVMAFDEKGQADTYERRIEICNRAYRLLVHQVGLSPRDIIFDPNILAIATGMPEHDAYALDFIRATEWIHKHLPGTHVSGGVSNLSFSFRGNNYVREAMHAVFLYHAQQKGMDFGIVNPSSKVMYADIPADQLNVFEDAILRPSHQASERLVEMASLLAEQASQAKDTSHQQKDMQQELSVEDRLVDKLRRGISQGLEYDLNQALQTYPRAVDIIEGPLMKGMNLVGQLFGEGKMFLPQVVKTARTMKQAVAILQPYIEAQRADSHASSGKVLLATVKGDVHDIGKNIVSVVLACNGFEVIDLGVMVPEDVLLAKAMECQPDIIGLSGLITPSLTEMIKVAQALEKAGIRVPIMVGGATTSPLHTALKIAPAYSGPVIWTKDASQAALLAARFMNPALSKEALADLRKTQEELRRQSCEPANQLSIEEARANKLNLFG
ncbi:MAG: methionine synthase [Bacteroidaceae bacterium]